MTRRILVAIALAAALPAIAFVTALHAPALHVAAQTALPPPGKIGDQTFNNVTIQETLVVTGTMTTAGVNNYGADAGSTDAYVATLTPAPTAYVTGRLYVLKAATANTGAATVNFNGIGAVTIVKAVSTTLSNNDILANMLCLLVYDGTNMVLLNPRAL